MFGPADQAAFERLRRAHYPADRNRVSAHLTLFHHLPPSILPELKQRLAAETRGVAAPAASAAGLIDLGRGVAVRIDSPALAAIRARLAEAFAPLLTPQDRAGWRGHVTIQNKVTPAQAKATLAALSHGFAPHPVHIAGLASWYYRDTGWEPVGRYKFA